MNDDDNDNDVSDNDDSDYNHSEHLPSHVHRSREKYAWYQEGHTVLDHGTVAEVETDETVDHSCGSFCTNKSQLNCANFLPKIY